MPQPTARPPTDSRFLLPGDHEPGRLGVLRAGAMASRVEAALAELAECRVCPRDCGINRLEDESKVCRTGRHAIVSSAFPHFGEEDCLRGWKGSGTIFFAGCNLRCVYCQNWDISQRVAGREMTAPEIADLMLALQERGCHNINLVTPEHVVPQVIEALADASRRGLTLPVIYNTSAYDSLESLGLLDGLIDIYMPDLKFWSIDPARRLAKAKDYPERARRAVREMHRQVGDLKFGADGMARQGLLVRHLVMPGQTAEAAAIFRWLAEEISPDTWVNVMEQYRPAYQVGDRYQDGRPRYGDIERRPLREEIDAAYDAARQAGLWRFDARRRRGVPAHL